MSSLITRIRATMLSKNQVKMCKIVDRELLVRIANELGYHDTDMKREGNLCRYILVKVASNPTKYKKQLDEIRDAYNDIRNVFVPRRR